MNRYRQILVHAGLSKTGTTSIQVNCEKHSAYLQQQGIIYPRFAFGDEPFITHSIPLTASVTGSPGKYGLRLRQRFSGDVDAVIKACREQLEEVLGTVQGDTLLLSTELIEGFDDKDMAALRALLSPHTEKLRVVTYIRSPQSALESLLQERTKAGAAVAPEALVGRVRQKVENLQRNFPDALEVINFHEALHHPRGLVGSFLSLLGLADKDMQDLDFVSVNQRLGMEAFLLMSAINRRYPRKEQDSHKVARNPGDLDALAHLPGPAFQLTDFTASGVHRACLEEAAWLESSLGFRFPEVARSQSTPLWQGETVAALEQAIGRLQSDQLRRCAAQFLGEEARQWEVSRPATAQQLNAISRQLLSRGSG